MEEPTNNANMILLIIDIVFILSIIIFYIYAAIFLNKAIYKENIKNTNYFSPFLSCEDHLLNFISPKIKLISISRVFSIVIILSILGILFWLTLLLLWSEFNFKLFFPHYFVFILMVLLDIFFIFGTISYIFKKRAKLETDNKTLRKDFQSFIENWANNNYLRKANFVFNFDSKIKNNLFNYKYNYAIYNSLNFLKIKTNFQENNYYVIYQFRVYLTNVRKDFDELLENVTSVNGVYSTDKNFVDKLKWALVNNFIFALKQI